jgi:LPXTG-site transpeptidase (sortase) family protein
MEAHPLCAALISLCLLAGCSAAPTGLIPRATLPEPQVVSATLTLAPTQVLSPTHTLQPQILLTATPFPEDAQGLALAAYGERMLTWLRIPAIDVLAPVVAVGWAPEKEDPATLTWDSPEASVGWAMSSALPDEDGGNVIVYGHNNIHSSVFRNLWKLQAGDVVSLGSGRGEDAYVVGRGEGLPGLEAEGGMAGHCEYLKPSRAPRLTLISCWPPTGNTHRVIVVAYPQIIP